MATRSVSPTPSPARAEVSLISRLGFWGPPAHLAGFLLLSYGFKTEATGDEAGMVSDDPRRPGQSLIRPFVVVSRRRAWAVRLGWWLIIGGLVLQILGEVQAVR